MGENELEMDHFLTIRSAGLEDWKTIAEFNSRLADETEGKQLPPATIAAGVQTLLKEERHGRYFVACRKEQIVGQMMHTREWSDWRNGEIWWLQSIYVHPEHRRTGVFRALYHHIERLAEKTPQVVGIRLYVERHNAKAVEAYDSLGFADAGYTIMERLFGKPL